MTLNEEINEALAAEFERRYLAARMTFNPAFGTEFDGELTQAFLNGALSALLTATVTPGPAVELDVVRAQRSLTELCVLGAMRGSTVPVPNFDVSETRAVSVEMTFVRYVASRLEHVSPDRFIELREIYLGGAFAALTMVFDQAMTVIYATLYAPLVALVQDRLAKTLS